jgi:hypothetical protein
VGCWQKGGHLCPSELFVEQPFSVLVNPMDLENVFCQIDSNSFNVHDSSARSMMTIYRPTVAQEMGGDHSINKAPVTQ